LALAGQPPELAHLLAGAERRVLRVAQQARREPHEGVLGVVGAVRVRERLGDLDARVPARLQVRRLDLELGQRHPGERGCGHGKQDQQGQGEPTHRVNDMGQATDWLAQSR
jgi:hypothetical protein